MGDLRGSAVALEYSGKSTEAKKEDLHGAV